jgi:hypothetical protein
MVANDYSDAHEVQIHQKDIDIISDFAARPGCPTPLFERASRFLGGARARAGAKGRYGGDLRCAGADGWNHAQPTTSEERQRRQMSTTMSTQSQAAQTLAWNMKLVAQHELSGFGGVGEGTNMQKTKDGRRIFWMAHESANFTAVDVTDPGNPGWWRTDCRTATCARTADVVGDAMAVATRPSGGSNCLFRLSISTECPG